MMNMDKNMLDHKVTPTGTLTISQKTSSARPRREAEGVLLIGIIKKY